MNGLNAPIKRHWLKGCIKKKKKKTSIYNMLLQETHFRVKDAILINEGVGKDISWEWMQQKAKDSNTHIRQNRL